MQCYEFSRAATCSPRARSMTTMIKHPLCAARSDPGGYARLARVVMQGDPLVRVVTGAAVPRPSRRVQPPGSLGHRSICVSLDLRANGQIRHCVGRLTTQLSAVPITASTSTWRPQAATQTVNPKIGRNMAPSRARRRYCAAVSGPKIPAPSNHSRAKSSRPLQCPTAF